MLDQNKHEIKRHEKLKKIIVDEWTSGKYTYNPQLSDKTKRIIEKLEARESADLDSLQA